MEKLELEFRGKRLRAYSCDTAKIYFHADDLAGIAGITPKTLKAKNVHQILSPNDETEENPTDGIPLISESTLWLNASVKKLFDSSFLEWLLEVAAIKIRLSFQEEGIQYATSGEYLDCIRFDLELSQEAQKAAEEELLALKRRFNVLKKRYQALKANSGKRA